MEKRTDYEKNKTWNEEVIICPYCEYKHEYDCEYIIDEGSDNDIECGNCEKEFNYKCEYSDIKFTTIRKDEEFY